MAVTFHELTRIAQTDTSFKSRNIPKTEGGKNHLNFMTVKFNKHKKGFVGAKVFHWQHALAYHQPHVMVTRLSPLPQFARYVMEKIAREGGRAGTLHPETH